MSNSNVRVTIQTDKGKWKRRNDEYFAYLTPVDPVMESTHGTIIVLADGMGGNINSNLGAKIAVESLIEFYMDQDSKKTIEDRIQNSFQEVHELIKEKAESFHTEGMICALTAIIVRDHSIWIGHVGTNRVFLLSPKNELNELNSDTDMFIGQKGKISVQIQQKKIDPGSHLLLVSDGITNQISLEMIAKACAHGTPSGVVNHLIQLGNEAGGEDNMTACFIEIGKFVKKAISIPDKEESVKKRNVIKPIREKKSSSFWLWILIIFLLVGGLILAKKYYPYIMNLLLPGNEKPISEVVIKPPDQPPVIKEEPEASLLITVTPNIVTVFLYEGEVSLNEKQKDPIFSSESTPTTIKGLKTGIYTLIIGKDGYEPYRQVIQIKDTDLTKELPIPLILKPVEQESGTTIPEPPAPIEIEKPKPPAENTVEVLNELIIQSEPGGAKIFVNGSATGLVTPNVIKKKPGVYLIQIMKDGYESASRSVDLSGESSKQTIYMKMKPIPISLLVNSQPGGAKIYIDNIFTGKYTPATISLSIGSHTIMVGKAGFEEQSATITIAPGSVLKPLLFTLIRKPGVTP